MEIFKFQIKNTNIACKHSAEEGKSTVVKKETITYMPNGTYMSKYFTKGDKNKRKKI